MNVKLIVMGAVLLLSSLALAKDYATKENEYKYESFSGQKYKYDLQNPSDRLKYDLDLDAQMKDSLKAPISPKVGIDRSMGQYGGGILDD